MNNNTYNLTPTYVPEYYKNISQSIDSLDKYYEPLI